MTFRAKLKAELKEIAALALPVVGTNYVNFGAGFTDQVFIGTKREKIKQRTHTQSFEFSIFSTGYLCPFFLSHGETVRKPACA